MEKKLLPPLNWSSGRRFVLVQAGLAWAVGWKTMASQWSVKRWKYFFSLYVCQMNVFFGFWVMVKCLNIWKKFFATSNITYYFLVSTSFTERKNVPFSNGTFFALSTIYVVMGTFGKVPIWVLGFTLGVGYDNWKIMSLADHLKTSSFWPISEYLDH